MEAHYIIIIYDTYIHLQGGGEEGESFGKYEVMVIRYTKVSSKIPK